MEAFAHKADKSKVDIGSVLTAPNAPQNNNEFYFDYQNGEYGFNTDPERGADTFHPFKSGLTPSEMVVYTGYSGTSGNNTYHKFAIMTNNLASLRDLTVNPNDATSTQRYNDDNLTINCPWLGSMSIVVKTACKKLTTSGLSDVSSGTTLGVSSPTILIWE